MYFVTYLGPTLCATVLIRDRFYLEAKRVYAVMETRLSAATLGK